jgi:hypothetical protein
MCDRLLCWKNGDVMKFVLPIILLYIYIYLYLYSTSILQPRLHSGRAAPQLRSETFALPADTSPSTCLPITRAAVSYRGCLSTALSRLDNILLVHTRMVVSAHRTKSFC